MQLNNNKEECPMNRMTRDEWIFMSMCMMFLFLVLYLDL